MPKAKRRKNIFGFGRKSSGNYIPASGGIAKHAPKHRAKAKTEAADSTLDEVARSLAGKPYSKLSASQQATVRGFASKMNPKRNPSIQTQVFSNESDAERFAKLLRDKGRKVAVAKHGVQRWKVKWISPHARKRNVEIGLPKNQFVNAKVRMKGGKIQVMADERILGKAGFKAGAGLSGVSVSGGAKLNPRKRRRK